MIIPLLDKLGAFAEIDTPKFTSETVWLLLRLKNLSTKNPSKTETTKKRKQTSSPFQLMFDASLWSKVNWVEALAEESVESDQKLHNSIVANVVDSLVLTCSGIGHIHPAWWELVDLSVSGQFKISQDQKKLSSFWTFCFSNLTFLQLIFSRQPAHSQQQKQNLHRHSCSYVSFCPLNLQRHCFRTLKQ